MKRFLPALLLLMLCAAAWAQTTASAPTVRPVKSASGPAQAWNVFTLPNPAVTPNWRTFAPSDCTSNYDTCTDDNRFWEEWDFSADFGPNGAAGDAIDAAFNAVASQGKYQGVMMLMPLADVTQASAQWEHFSSNIQLMYTSAASHGVAIEPVLFPKYKYGAEWCYLYPTAASAPSACDVDTAAGKTLAFEKLVQMMDFVQTLNPSGGCTTPGTFNSWFAVWYGWADSELPANYNGTNVLENFWNNLPTVGPQSGCNLQAAYITWLDSGYAGNQDVHNLQTYVAQHGGTLYVNTELYSTSQIQTYANTFANQTVITGYWGATDIANWAKGMCSKWKSASRPARLGVWTFDDRDADPPYELYRSYINNDMAVVGSICGH